MRRRISFTGRRRAQLAHRVAALEVMEPRNMIIESLGVLAFSIGIPTGLVALVGGPSEAQDESEAQKSSVQEDGTAEVPDQPIVPGEPVPYPDGVEEETTPGVAASMPREVAPSPGDWLTLIGDPIGRGEATSDPGPSILAPSAAVAQVGGGGGGSGGDTGALTRGAIAPLRVVTPQPDDLTSPSAIGMSPASPASLAMPTQVASSEPTGSATTETEGTPGPASAKSGTTSFQSFGILDPGDTASASTDSGGLLALSDPGLFDVGGLNTSASLGSFSNFPLYTLDYNNGVVLFPGSVQLATLNGSADLRAQVRDTTVLSYSWDTTNLTHAVNITGANTYRLRFQWTDIVAAAATDSVTLTVTDTSNRTEVQTYSFRVPAGDDSGGGIGPNATWPVTLAPDLVQPRAAAFASHNAAVKATSGALGTSIALPGYSPNISPIVLSYDSLAADPRPIVVVHHTLDETLTVPTKVSGQLTFNGTAGSTFYYDTSQFIPGDVMQMALQVDATALATGRYDYSVAIADIRATTTTTTVTGTATVINEANNPIGAGWTLDRLNRIHAATGGVILNAGAGVCLWFATGAGGAYTSPAGDFSTLVQNADNTWTRTLDYGVKQEFGTDGRQTAAVDRNGLRVTYAYDDAGKLTTITDPYGKVTTFAYDGSNKLQTVTDPSGRVATITHSGNNLTGVTLPEAVAWGYGYDAAGRMTSLTDPRSKTLTVNYDGAGRVSGTTRPDTTTQSFTPYQKRGWVAPGSGTSDSPATATLLAEARASYTDPRANVTDLRPDWRGMGLTNQVTDPYGYVTTRDRDANGLATITIDRLNRITQRQFDSKGNVTQLTYPDLNTERFTYNSFSQPTSHTDPLNRITTYTYDANGNLTSVQDALSNRTTMAYTATGRLATVRDARDNVTSYAYDSQDRLTTTTYPGGATRLIAYDAAGNATTVTDERSNSTTYGYDAMGRRTGMTDALGHRTTSTYDAAGNLTAVQLPLSRTTHYAYDSMDRVTTITAPLSRVTVYGYDAAGNPMTVTDPLNRVTTMVYDALNRRTVVIDPLSHRTTYAYDTEGQVLSVADPLNRVTSYTYHSRGWRQTVIDPLGNTTNYSYTATGQRATRSDEDSGGSGGLIQSFSYDALDRRIATTDGLGHTTSFIYDEVGNRSGIIDANNHRTTYIYDARNRVIAVIDPLSHTTSYGYDAVGNRTTVTDPLGNVTTTAYDALDRVTTITDARNGQALLSYDAAGRQTVVVDPVGNRTTLAYDAADRVTTITDPRSAATTFAYDAADKLTDRTDRAGRRVTFAYDADGRRTNERWLDGSGSIVRTITYTYDAGDQLTGVTDPDATLTFTYDNGGRRSDAATSSTAGQPSVTLTSGYNALDQRTRLVDNLASVGRTTYTYDAAHRLTQITRSLGGTAGPRVDYGYDAGNRMTTVERTIGGVGKAVTTSLAYDAADRLTTLTHQAVDSDTGGSGGGTIVTPLATYTYGYDNADRLTSETNAEGTVAYSFDATDQLTGVTGARTETYGYDLMGNRNTTGYTTDTGNWLTAGAGYTFTYDAEGNLTSKTETATGNRFDLTWDHRNRLTGVTKKNSGGTAIMQATYTYDAQDRRIGTKVDADGDGPGAPVQTWAVYDGKNTYADFDGSGALKQRYLHGLAIDELLARTDSGTTAWYLTDKLGTVRDISNASGAIIYHAAYDSFGKMTSETGTGGDRFKFTGREYDTETGLYYYRARYYNPTTGRFISQDPMGFEAGDLNLFRYVNNNPVQRTDPLGLRGVIDWIYTGYWDPPDDVRDAAYEAAGESYSENDDLAHGALDVISAAPVAGAVADAAQTGLYLAEGNYTEAAMTAGGLGLGFLGDLGKIDDVADAVSDYGDEAADAIGCFDNACFAAGTPLLTPEGAKPIEQFRPGDWVLSCPEDDPEAVPLPQRVEAVFTNYAPLLNIRIGIRTIRTTAEHPFWVRGRGWTAAHQLMAGDHLRSHDGRWVVLDGIEGGQEAAPVYNLQITQYHTYFVGDTGWGFSIWSHNVDCWTVTSRPVDLQRPGNPNAPPGSPENVGGTFVTTKNPMDSGGGYWRHVDENVPAPPDKPIVTQIDAPPGVIKPDPTGPTRPNTGWIPPDSGGSATIIDAWDVEFDEWSNPTFRPR